MMSLDTLHQKPRREGGDASLADVRVQTLSSALNDTEALNMAYYRDDPMPTTYNPAAAAEYSARQGVDPAQVAQAAGSAEFWNEMNQPAPAQVNAEEQAALDAVYAAHAQAQAQQR